MKKSHLQIVETKTKKWFLRNFLEKLFKKWFPIQLNSTVKNSRTVVFQESVALSFK